MKQLLILSGKGGTGKTTIASAFIKLSQSKRFADCDVDAPNLHLVMDINTSPEKDDFYGLDKASIVQEQCIKCGLCKEHCNFDSISYDEDKDEYKVDYFACEGCTVCDYVCPADAINMKAAVVGDLMLYSNESVFSTAQLRMGSGNSGLLVTEVKNRMKLKDVETDIAIIDGSPGIGCPVIASISGVDMVLIVTEPSVSGISDLERVIATVNHFKIPVAVCINKYDVNEENTEKIVKLCEKKDLPFVGKIPFDKNAIDAVNQGLTIVDIDCVSGEKTKDVYKNTINYLNKI